MLTSLMTELAGDDGRAGGALLRQVRGSYSPDPNLPLHLGIFRVW